MSDLQYILFDFCDLKDDEWKRWSEIFVARAIKAASQTGRKDQEWTVWAREWISGNRKHDEWWLTQRNDLFSHVQVGKDLHPMQYARLAACEAESAMRQRESLNKIMSDGYAETVVRNYEEMAKYFREPKVSGWCFNSDASQITTRTKQCSTEDLLAAERVEGFAAAWRGPHGKVSLAREINTKKDMIRYFSEESLRMAAMACPDPTQESKHQMGDLLLVLDDLATVKPFG